MTRPEKKWQLLNEEKIQNSHTLIEVLLKNRGILTDQQDEFLNPLHPSDYIKKYEPFVTLSHEVEKAKALILETIEANLPIIIHGDYDADGQTATAILWRTIHNDLNYPHVHCYIPNRFDEGYGLSDESIEGMKKMLEEKGLSTVKALIITVDCGITAHKEVQIAMDKGFKVIITDHHQGSEIVPTPNVLVWTDKSVGAGISWLLSHALLENNLNVDKYLDLACIGTVCDLQPLIGFNRSVVKHGLRRLNENPTLGIKILAEMSEIKLPFDTYHLGWVLGPKLNATGRLESALDSLNLLITDSTDEANIYAKKLTELNKQRQDKTKIDYEFAITQTMTTMTTSPLGSNLFNKEITTTTTTSNFLITSSETYHEGVIGLVAGKLVQTFHKPAIAIVKDKETGMAKGSARSIEGISIIETLRKFGHLFEKLGGHDMAAGFSLKTENLPELEKSLAMLNSWPPEVFSPTIKIDTEIDASLLAESTYESIQQLRPFGVKNAEPTFLLKRLDLFNVTAMGRENNHLKLFFTLKNNQQIAGIWFSATDSESSKQLKIGSTVDVVFTFSINEWNGRKSLELRVKNAKPSS